MIQEAIVSTVTQLGTDNLPQVPQRFILQKGLPS